MKYMFYTDPGHGWIRVKVEEIEEMGIADKISHFSYKKGRYAYLEEDSDAGIFLNRYKEIHGKNPEIGESNTNSVSKIRRFESWK